MKETLGIMLALLIGAGCRWFGIPSPAPDRLIGAVLVLSMCVGYLLMGKCLELYQPAATTEAVAPQVSLDKPPADQPSPSERAP
jgi:XapX domain-containing protein